MHGYIRGLSWKKTHLCVLIHIWNKGEVGVPRLQLNIFPDRSKAVLLLWIICVCHAFGSDHFYLVVIWRERADLLALVCDVYCDFVTFPFGILGQVWYLIVWIPDPCCLSYFYTHKINHIAPFKSTAKSLFSVFFIFFYFSHLFKKSLKKSSSFD